jgi:hypothetical protein
LKEIEVTRRREGLLQAELDSKAIQLVIKAKRPLLLRFWLVERFEE